MPIEYLKIFHEGNNIISFDYKKSGYKLIIKKIKKEYKKLIFLT